MDNVPINRHTLQMQNNPIMDINQQIDQNLFLNIKTLNFLQILGSYTKIKIICNKKCCGSNFSSVRSYQVLGINEEGLENSIMTASQEELNCCTEGYMLVYKMNGTIFGTLGYQFNPRCNICGMTCCDNCCSCDSCCKSCCSGCCDCCSNCCNNGGCCRGGCCQGGCCCCCEDGCCEGGFCTCCNCCCFEGGCCKEPCCKKGCCPCPNWEYILLDVRFLNTMQEALNQNAGLYVSTLYEPFSFCGCNPLFIGYKKCGEKYILDNKCFPISNVQLAIRDLKTKEVVGNIMQTKPVCSDVQSYDVDFPKDALPLEKLLIISEVFMFVFRKWDEGGKNEMIITKKRRFLPGLNSDFI